MMFMRQKLLVTTKGRQDVESVYVAYVATVLCLPAIRRLVGLLGHVAETSNLPL